MREINAFQMFEMFFYHVISELHWQYQTQM
jgi:hypothetical protein